MLDYDSAERALIYLGNTDESCAKAKALLEGLEDQKKTVEAIEFMRADGSAAERKQKALASENYQEHIERIENARLEFETLRNKRLTATLQIEMWRSVNSNQRKGNV